MKPMFAFWFLIPVAIACASCRETPVTPPGPVDAGAGGAPASDASTDAAPDADLDPCERACRRLAVLGCAEAEPTPGGASCVEVCRNVEESGVVSLDPECVSQVARCEDVDGCTRWNSAYPRY